jgi:cytochrome c5
MMRFFLIASCSRRAQLALGVMMLGACHAAKPLTPAQSAARHPADAHLAALYDGSCRACHTSADSGAPLSGDHTQWDARWAKGPAVLLQNAVGGYNRMPAGGQCATCTAADYAALIRFMAGQET